jgi:hypothetical protein
LRPLDETRLARTDTAPASWRQTIEFSDTQQLLDANMYRRATLRPEFEVATIDAVR